MDSPEDLEPDDADAPEERGPRVKVKCGVDWELEAQADVLLRASREGLTKVSDKQDFLTTDQLERRRCREVLVAQGFPESHLYSGIYRRAWNPNADTRPSNDSHRFMDH